MIGFIIGLFIGGSVGFITCCLFTVGKRGEWNDKP